MDIATKLTQIAEKEAENIELNNQFTDTLVGTGGEVKTFYDEFWDSYLNSMKGDFSGAFSGLGWNKTTFTPPRGTIIRPLSYTTHMFSRNGLSNIDLVELCEELDIVFDFSKTLTFIETFYLAGMVRVGVIDTRNANNLTSIFAGASNIKIVDKVIFKEDGSQTFGNNSFKFYYTNAGFEEIRFEGMVGNTTNKPLLDLQWHTRLSEDSVRSLVGVLSKDSAGTLTLSATAVNNAFTTEEWIELITDKSNTYNGKWTITLV